MNVLDQLSKDTLISYFKLLAVIEAEQKCGKNEQ